RLVGTPATGFPLTSRTVTVTPTLSPGELFVAVVASTQLPLGGGYWAEALPARDASATAATETIATAAATLVNISVPHPRVSGGRPGPPRSTDSPAAVAVLGTLKTRLMRSTLQPAHDFFGGLTER